VADNDNDNDNDNDKEKQTGLGGWCFSGSSDFSGDW
jgi:hypothetical protein